jgi:hypothetical protein
VVTFDQYFTTHQTFHDGSRFVSLAERDIAEDVNEVVRLNDFVPHTDHRFVHVLNVLKLSGCRVEFHDVGVAEVKIRRNPGFKICVHLFTL